MKYAQRRLNERMALPAARGYALGERRVDVRRQHCLRADGGPRRKVRGL